MAGNLSDRYQKRLDAAAKRGKSSFNVTRNGKKSSAINQRTVDAIRGDEEGVLIVQENNAEQIALAINQAVALAREEIGQKAERHAKAECPVDTGRLRNSITHVLDGDDAYVGTNVSYSVFVHEGVRGRPGIPFLRNAAQNHTTEYRNVLKKHLSGQ